MTIRSVAAVTVLFLWSITNVLQSQNPHPKLQAGPMIGSVEFMEVGLWVQTTEPAHVSITYHAVNSDSFTDTVTVTRHTESETHYIAQFRITDIPFGTEFAYDLFIDGEKAEFDYPLTFETQEYWIWRKPAPDLSFATGSCLYINDPEYDRPGKGYGDHYYILETIADKSPDFMLWTGDNVYYREPDFYSASRLEYRNRHTRSVPEMQRLLATTAHYAIWDDHDYGPNNSARNYIMKKDALELFKAYWMNPSYGIDDTEGVFTRFSWSDVDFILTDDRYHRAPNELKEEDKAFWGDEQLQWIKDQLLTSNGTFKVIVNGNQSVNMNNPYEGLHDYPDEQRELMNFIKEHEIEGVIFFSGDRHHTELLKYEEEGLYPLYEFTNSPLTAGYNSNLRSEEENPLRVDGTLVNTTRNFGYVNVTGERNNRVMTLKTYDKDGKLLWEYEINEQELKME